MINNLHIINVIIAITNNNIIIGLRGDKIMPLLEARKQILMVMYKHLIDTRLQKEYQMINKMKEEEGKKIVIVCEGQENGEREEDESNHFGSAGMLKLFLIR